MSTFTETNQALTCPRCKLEIELSSLVRQHIEADLRATIHREVEQEATRTLEVKNAELEVARVRVMELSGKEADLLKRQREIDEREQQMKVEFERAMLSEVTRIREHEAVAAEERAGRVAAERIRMKDIELATANRKLTEATEKEALLLQRSREVEDRERRLALDIERAVAEQVAPVRELERKAAEERAARAADERVRQKDEELEAAKQRLGEATSREAKLLERSRELEERERQMIVDTESKLADATARIREQEAKAARERAEREAEASIRSHVEEIEAMRQKLGEASQRELDLSKKARELDQREHDMKLEAERRLTEETARIREQVATAAEERVRLERDQHTLRDEEHRQQVERLQRTVDELQSRLRVGSQQTQGEAQEVVLRDLLEQAFRHDEINDVPKGINGADIIQRVRTPDGLECDSIIWESKRTKSWSDEWLAKVRDDQREARAGIAVIVTQTLPRGVRHFDLIEGVWVCAWQYAPALAAVLRGWLTELARSRRAANGALEKQQLIYRYVTGPELTNRLGGLVESIHDMHEDLVREKRAVMTLWKRREKQIERAVINVTSLYGDLQGIVGAELTGIPQLELGVPDALPSGSDDDEERLDGSRGPSIAAPSLAEDGPLVELLFTLLPVDGTPIGNGALMDVFADAARERLGRLVDEEIYVRCKEHLLAVGLARRGKGRGGAVARVAALREAAQVA